MEAVRWKSMMFATRLAAITKNQSSEKLTTEQAKLTLFGHAMLNDQGAKDLLKYFLRKPTPKKDSQ